MRSIRTMMAVLVALGLCTHAQAQYGLYGAPSTLPLPTPHPVSQSAPYQTPQLYADTNAATGPVVAGPVVANHAPQYANPAYTSQTYGYGQAPAQAGYGSMARQLPMDPAYSSPVVPAAVQTELPPPPARAPQVGQPGPITQMLNESSNAYSAYGQSTGCGVEADCGSCDVGCEPCCPRWFGSVAALYMTRDEPNRLWTSYETNNNPNQLPTDAYTEWEVGGEITIGRYFGCNTCAPSCDPCGSGCNSCGYGPLFGIEVTYWGLGLLEGYSSQSIAGGSVSTPLLVDGIEFGGVNGTVYFDSAAEHFVRRENEIHNIEINLLGGPGFTYGGYAEGFRPVSFGWNAGARYFRFEENFLFGSVDTGRTWGEGGGIYEAYLEDNVRNSLVGFQFGCDLSYNVLSRWRLYAAPKFGIYNNHVEHEFGLRRGDGVIANPTAASGVTGSYPVSSSEDVISFLSEVDLGLDWQVAQNWSVFLGYRVIFATGIALADNQIPAYVVDIPEIADIDTNGDLVLHGAFAGVTINY